MHTVLSPSVTESERYKYEVFAIAFFVDVEAQSKQHSSLAIVMMPILARYMSTVKAGSSRPLFLNQLALWHPSGKRWLNSRSTHEFRQLSDGNKIPALGFGTYELESREAKQAVTWALEAGYRHIDSATWYYNERECGEAILEFCKATGTPRSEIFFTTKLMHNNGYENVKKAIQKSLDVCGLGYIDLYLIHGPWGGPQARKEAWEAICDAQKEGKLKSIGISTFGLRHMQELIATGLPVPAVHQIDLHPFQTHTEIVKFSKKHGMTMEAWAPLVRCMRFKHPEIQKLARKYGKEPAQILLRYSLQKGYVPIPKSSKKARIVSNTQVFDFELSEEEIQVLDGLDEGLATDWDPTNCP